MLALSDEELAGLSTGLSLLKHNKFQESHEVFEAFWRCTTGTPRVLFHALAQIAASYHQLSLARARASIRTWYKARTKLAAIGALAEPFDREVAELYAVLKVTNEGPRFIDPAVVAARLPLPVPGASELGVVVTRGD
jgi:hypothetical protein